MVDTHRTQKSWLGIDSHARSSGCSLDLCAWTVSQSFRQWVDVFNAWHIQWSWLKHCPIEVLHRMECRLSRVVYFLPRKRLSYASICRCVLGWKLVISEESKRAFRLVSFDFADFLQVDSFESRITDEISNSPIAVPFLSYISEEVYVYLWFVKNTARSMLEYR